MKIRPLNDWVLLEEAEAEEVSAGGIIIPQIAKEKPQWGTVIAAGPGANKTEKKGKEEKKRFVATEVKPGDKVLFEKYMAKDFETAGEKILMVREEYILGILDSEGGSKSLQKKAPSELEKKIAGAVEKKKTGALEKTKKAAAPKTKSKK